MTFVTLSYIASVNALMDAGVAPKIVKLCIQYSYTKGKVAILASLIFDIEQRMESL